MRIYITDDMPHDRDLLKQYITAYANEQHIEYAIYEYASAEELLSNFAQADTEPTILFLDIYMGKVNGMEAAQKIVARGFNGSLIFTTTSPDFAVESYDVNADGYLKKPYAYTSFVRAMERCRKKWEQSIKAITVAWDRIEYQVPLLHIKYIESGDHCSLIHTKDKTVKTNKTITQLEAELKTESNFIRCGRGYIVNLNAVETSDDTFIHLKSGERVLIPIREKIKIKQLIADYYWSKTRELGSTHG